MAEVNMEKAKQVYETLCAALEAEDWKFQRDEENLRIESSAQGEDLPIDIRIKVVPKQQLILLLSEIPFKFPEDKRVDGAVAVSIVNDRLVDGCFDYDIKSGEIWFRLTSSYIESEVSMEVFKYMLYVSCQTVDDYNDKFLMVGKGMMEMNALFSED